MNHELTLIAFLAGELDGPDLTAYQIHLAGCDACRRALDEDRRGRTLIETMIEPVPDLSRARLLANLRDHDAATRSPLHRSLLPWVAAACLVLVAAVGIGRSQLVPTEPAANPSSVIAQLVSTTGPADGTVMVTSRSIGGEDVVIATSTDEFAMPADASPASDAASDVWLVHRSGITILCQNGTTSRLVASRMPADQLLELLVAGRLD